MSRKTRPYLFYDTTQSVCTTCLRQVEAKIVLKDDKVYMDKWCPVHGSERVLVSDDVAWYRLGREVFVKHPEMPRAFAQRPLPSMMMATCLGGGRSVATSPESGCAFEDGLSSLTPA